jgi:hypothetical protein
MAPHRASQQLPFGSLVLAILAILPLGPSLRGDEPAVRPGRRIPGPDGQTITLGAPEAGATALVFLSTECPISNAYSPTLNRIAAEFPPTALRLVGVCVDPDLSNAEVVRHARDFGLAFPLGRDRAGALAGRLGVTVTPEAVVLDDRGRVRYRGRIDDQFAARQRRNAAPGTHELRDAIAAVLAGREVSRPHVEAVGCPLPEVPEGAKGPTFTRDVAPILRENCQECHRRGQVGPFPLESFAQARKRAEDIAAVVEGHAMPPWKPVPGVGPGFKNDRSLAPEEVAALIAWAQAGAPEGDPADLPPPRDFADEWALGTPDLILEPAQEFTIPAEARDQNGKLTDIYRCFVLPTDLPDDVYIVAIEYRPGNRRVVHHVLSYVDATGQGRKRDADDPGPGYTCFSGPGVEVHGDLGGWAPGNEPSRLPDGVGRFLPRKADVVMQVHYHPDGKPETDRTRIGLHFARRPVKQTLHWAAALNLGMKLPPGGKNIEVRAAWKVPVDVEAHAVSPHMHQLGRDMTISVKYPNGRSQDLVKIADWDFGWQNTYYFQTPLPLPAGTVLNVVAHYDNPTAAEVRWGEATTDEMCIGFLALTKTGQDLTRPGENDDLRQIIDRSYEELKQEYERKRQEAGRRNAAAKASR